MTLQTLGELFFADVYTSFLKSSRLTALVRTKWRQKVTKENGHISPSAAKKALAEGARLIQSILAPGWTCNERVTRNSQQIRNPCSDEQHFAEAVKVAEE